MKTKNILFSLRLISEKMSQLKTQSRFLTRLFMFMGYLVLSWVFAVCSQIIIPLPFNFVPVSLQPMPLLLAALLLGRHGVYAYGLYLAQGAAGLPFFAGMQGGLVRLMGPTGGYLIGFGVAMIFLASIRLYKPESVLLTFAKLLCAGVIYFSMGLAQLAWFVPANKVLACGLFPFIIGDSLKIIFVTMIVKRVGLK